MRRVFLFSAFCLLFSNLVFAQLPVMGGGTNSGGNKGGGFKMPDIARVYGKILDAKTKEPVEFASAALFVFDKDSVIAGVLAKGNGDFSLDNLPAVGAFRLKITFIGYKDITQKIFINPQKIEQDLGNILLEPDEALLNEVTITGEKSTFTMSIDRKVYNVDKDISVRGGTALDVMKNVPSVTVDVDGNATLRNSATQIYVDGRPTGLTLAQIPADQIDRVEVITNPSVKFDAGTTGGILNIVMKKNTKPGYNGMVMGSIGSSNSNASPNRYNGMGSFNLKQNPFNFSLMYNYNTQQNVSNGFTNRTDRSNGTDYGLYKQNNVTDMSNTFQFGRLGIDYFVNNRNTLTLSENIVSGKFNTIDKQNFTQEYYVPSLFGYTGNKINNQGSGFRNYTTQLQYKRTYPKQGQEWTADLNHNYTTSSFHNYFDTYRYDTSGNPFATTTDHQVIQGGTEANQFTFQTDYVNPIDEFTKLEFGARSYYKKSTSISDASYVLAPETAVKDSFNSNHYKIDDMVNAAYINYTARKWGIGYQAGLRFEQSYYAGVIEDKNQRFSYSYPSKLDNVLRSIFPGIYLSKKLPHNQEVQLNFSRKINRPNFFQLMPFIMFADLKNYRIGNPQLTPEFINKSELNYNLIKGKTNFLSSFYFNYTESPITNMSYPSGGDSTVLVNTFINGTYSYTYGWDNTIKFTLFKNLDITGNLNVYYLNISSSNTQTGSSQNEGYSWNAKSTISYKFPKNLTLQINGNYEAPKIIPQGRTNPMYGFDISLNKMIKTKWIINASLSDVLNSRKMGTHYDTPYYLQDMSRRREVRYAKISVSYLFGKMDASIFKRKNQKGGQQGGMGNSDGLDF